MEQTLLVLRDGVWQFVGALFALLAIPAAFWIYLLQRRRKEVSFGHLARRRLLAVARELQPRVSVTLDGQPVQDVHMVVLGFKNSGNTPIVKSDFAQSLAFVLGGDARLLSVEVTRRQPSHLPVQLAMQSNSVEVDVSLLNPGDHFVLQALVSGKDPHFDPIVRIAGVVQAEQLQSASSRYGAGAAWYEVPIAAVAVLGMVYMVLSLGASARTQILALTLLAVAVFIAAYRWIRPRYGAGAERYIDDA